MPDKRAFTLLEIPNIPTGKTKSLTGFTLVEMLLVIAIIGTLSGFLLVATRSAREGTRRITCANNLRQIGVAVYMYAEDNNSRLIAHNLIFGFQIPGYPDLEPYLDGREIFDCPSFKYHDYQSDSHMSYGYNYQGLTESGGGTQGIPIETVTNSVQCIMFADSGRLTGPAEESYGDISKSAPLRARHGKGVNVLFVDGHVEWHRVSDIPVSGTESTIWWNY